MRANQFTCFTLAFIAIAFFSCKKQMEVIDDSPYQIARLTEIMPLEVGKYITYQTDSLVFTNFNRNEETHYYIEKDTIDGKFIDGAGQTNYRITRFLRDAAGSKPWFTAGTYFVTLTQNTVEVTENNLRFVKLVLPLKQGSVWKGNQYLPDEPYKIDFNNDGSMYKWEYVYTKTNDVFNYNGTPLNDIVMVTGVDNSDIADTVTVTATSGPINLSGKTLVYLRGTSSDTITLTATAPTASSPILSIYNRSNQPAKLNNIVVPVKKGRTYEYVDGKWTFGTKNDRGNRVDSLYTDLPPGSKDLLVEKYAKSIGPVYQEFVMWEYQNEYTGVPDDATKKGFGVKRRMINHN